MNFLLDQWDYLIKNVVSMTLTISLITFMFLTMLQIMYESMKVRVENVLERGKVGEEYITCEQEGKALSKWTDGFTRQDHSTVIQVCFLRGLLFCVEKDRIHS